MSGMGHRSDEVTVGHPSIWVFGYGSLMWDPGFDYAERSWARLEGWHRQFSIRSTQAWGTSVQPGLCLALHRGGTVSGMAYRLKDVGQVAALAALDQRERAYRKISVSVSLPDSRSVSAITYVYDPAHPRAQHGLTLAEQASLIAMGRGEKGTSRYYLESTVAMLDDHGCAEPYLADLAGMIARYDCARSISVKRSCDIDVCRSVER